MDFSTLSSPTVDFFCSRSMLVQIRRYRTSDLPAVLDSWETATRMAHEFMSDDFIAQERTNVADIYIPNTDTWVAEIDDHVVGFISLMGNEIGAIFLLPSFHGQGIGRSLMHKAKKLHGVLEVEVFQTNKIGRDFYEKCGFHFVEAKDHAPTIQKLNRLRWVSHNPRVEG